MWWINMCVIIRKRHFLCFLFFAYKLPLLRNKYKPTQNDFQNNRPGPQNFKSQYITEYQSLCVWGIEFVRKKAFGILRSWLCLVSMWNANFPCEYFIFVPLKFVHFKKGINFRCLSICLGYSRMAAVVVLNTDWRIQLASFSQGC